MGRRLFVPAAIAAAACALASCTGVPDPGGSGTSPGPQDVRTSSVPSPSEGSAAPVTPSTAADCSGATPSGSPAAAAHPYPVGAPGDAEELAAGLDTPWGMAWLPDGDALVTLRDEARVVRLSAGGELSDVAAGGDGGRVPGVLAGGEGGLLGIAVSPRFAEDSLVYLYRTTESGNEVVRSRLAGGRLSDPERVLRGIAAAGTHNGGRLAFGPDGCLYVTTGDGQERPRAQDRESLNGKILRVTPDGGVPPGNPFPGSPVWSLGHRNVQGIDWDAEGRMWASEFGQDRLDELNLISPGANYGWPLVEGDEKAPGADTGGFTAPVATWAPADASPSGLAVAGDAVYLAALRGERLWRVPVRDGGPAGRPRAYLEGDFGRLRYVGVAPDGALWVLTNQEADSRILRLPLG